MSPGYATSVGPHLTQCLHVFALAFFFFNISCAAGWDHGSGREAPHPFSHPGVEEERDRGHGGRSGQQEISSHTPATAGGQGEPAQVGPHTHQPTPGDLSQ